MHVGAAPTSSGDSMRKTAHRSVLYSSVGRAAELSRGITPARIGILIALDAGVGGPSKMASARWSVV